MNKTSRRTVHLLLGSIVLVAVAYGQIRVRVVDSNGSGLAGVRISSESDYGKSDENGYFPLDSRARVIRFSMDGFRPLTKTLISLQRTSDVRLTRDGAGLWKPPRCSATKKDSLMSGWHMQFVVPRGVQVRRGSDIDYSTNSACRGRDCLRHGWGPLWGSGMPPLPEEFLTGLPEVTERDIYNYDAPDFPGVEYRGVRSDGTYVRSVGIFGETITYDHVTKESAQLFDALIDSFCWMEGKP